MSALNLSNNNSSRKPRPMLKAASSVGLKRGNTPYKGVFGNDHPSNKLMVRQNSFNIRGRGTTSINLGGPSSFDKNGGAKSYGGTMDTYNYGVGDDDDIDGSFGQLHLNCDCEREKTIPLIEVMAIGAKNNRIDLMHTINDINSRMIYYSILPAAPRFGDAKSLPMNISRDIYKESIDENKEQIVKADTFDSIKSKSINAKHKRGLSNSGSTRRSSSIDIGTPSFENNTSYAEKAPITNMKIDEFTKIERLHSALRQCM